MISLIEQERTKFDDTPASRSRLSEQSWSLGDSREANILRRDAMRGKVSLQENHKAIRGGPETNTTAGTSSTPPFPSIPRGAQLSRDPKTGELVLGPAPSSAADIMGFDEDGRDSNNTALSKEEQRRRDAEFRAKFRAAQPGVLELGEMFGGRTQRFCTKTWREFCERPWFFAKWGGGWDTWQTSSSDAAEERRKRES